MIVTITGKPCSGKSSIGKVFSERYNFKLMPMGDIFREYAKKLGFGTITKFVDDERIKLIDAKVDGRIKSIGKKQLNDNIVFVSRTAWFLIPKSFKVFLDVSIDVAAERLVADKRESEPVKNKREAKLLLTQRWESENSRYQELYNKDNTHLENYDLVILTDNKTVDEIVLEIYNGYKKFLKQNKT